MLTYTLLTHVGNIKDRLLIYQKYCIAISERGRQYSLYKQWGESLTGSAITTCRWPSEKK